MKKLHVLFIVALLAVVSSCEKADPIESRLIGEWKIKSIKEEKKRGIGFHAITPTVGYEKIVFNANHTVELHRKLQPVVYGTWEYFTEQNQYVDPQGNVAYNYANVLNTVWDQELNYLGRNIVDVVRKQKLKFSNNDRNVVFECEK
ncbi:MAG TPA: hypothetical protein VK177_16700 [Flavobacteriales bacterium]|nr:hypothetical protein [Flavobacteriales bacterium]